MSQPHYVPAKLIICYALSEDEEQELAVRVLESPQTSLRIIIRNSDCGSHLLSSINKNEHSDVVDVVDENKISGFYRAKKKLDDVMANDVMLMVVERERGYFEFLCSKFFTPVITWASDKSSDISDNLSFSDQESALRQIRSVLSEAEASGQIEIIKSDMISDNLFYHGFDKRTGGLSTIAGMKSLNMVYTTAKRDPQCVIDEHRRRLAQKADFDVGRLHVARTVHGNTVHVIGQEPPEQGYDGVITKEIGITCGAPGADCIIMLFADPVKRACGAIHSGWMGTVKRICVETVRAMKEEFDSKPEDIRVVMGPSICKNCFEFGEEESQKFADIDPKCVVRVPGRTKPSIDLKLANRILLEREGVKPAHIDDSTAAFCTTKNPDAFFSYRRDGKPFGNQIGYIGIRRGSSLFHQGVQEAGGMGLP